MTINSVSNIGATVQGALELPAVKSLASKQVKILSNTPLKAGFFSYGAVLGSIAFSIFFVLLPLFHKLFDRMRTHFYELIDLKGDLSKNRIKVLQTELEKPILQPMVKLVQQGDYDGFKDYLRKTSESTLSPREVESKAKQLAKGGPEQHRKQLHSLIKEEYENTDEELAAIDFYDLIRIAKTVGAEKPEFARKVVLLEEGLELLQQQKLDKEIEANRIVLFTGDWNEKNLDGILEQLARTYPTTKHLEENLLRDKVFGTDPLSFEFKAGIFLVEQKIETLRDGKFASRCYNLIKALNQTEKVEVEAKVRSLIEYAYCSPLYRKLSRKQGRENPVVMLIQNIATKLHMEAPGMYEFRQFGGLYYDHVKKKCGALPEEGKRIAYLADVLDRSLNKHQSYNIETIFDKIVTWYRYSDKTRMAYISHHPETALDYNSYEVGNHDMAAGDYMLGGRRMRAAMGPTPGGDRTFEAHLEHMRSRGGIHLQHNLEHPAFSRGEAVRVKRLIGLQEQFPETLRVFSTPLDGAPMWLSGKAGKYFTDYSTVGEFLLKYAKFACSGQISNKENETHDYQQIRGDAFRNIDPDHDNGFYIGKEVMSDRQFRAGFEYASQAFFHVNAKTEDKKRLARALQVGAQGFTAVGAIVKAVKDSPELKDEILNATFKQACKLDIDRGVVLNVLTMVYFQLLSGKPLEEEQIKQMIGTVIARAELVAGRKIILKRYQPLSDALRLIGSNEKAVTRALKTYVEREFDVDPSAKMGFEALIVPPSTNSSRSCEKDSKCSSEGVVKKT